jgi:D-xylose transport system substrate-binding protein
MNIRTLLMTASLVLSVLIGLALARKGEAESSSASKGDAIKIGLSLDTLKEARWQGDRDRFVACCKKLGADVLVECANSDDTLQMQNVEALINSRVKVLVIVPHNGMAMAEAVKKANEAGIPVIAYDRLIQNCDLDLYLSFDNVRVGELQAQFLVDRLKKSGGKGRVVRIYGAPTDNNAKLFKEGQDKVLKPLIDRGELTVVHEDWADDWKPENAKKITNAAITKLSGQFEAVLASNDGTAGGAIQALAEEGLAGKILVTGQDAELAACQRIVAGTQSMTIYKPLKTLANGAAETAVQLARAKPIIARQSVANGRKDVPALLYDVVTVDCDNMVSSVINDEFQSYEDVYRGVPDDKRPKKQ